MKAERAPAAIAPVTGLQAVLAHERAHLHGHHHALLAWAGALSRAFGLVPLLAQAPAQLAVLAEMAADDAAVRSYPADDLAATLVTLARSGARAAALTAGGPAAIARIERLLAPPAARPARLAAAVLALIPPGAHRLPAAARRRLRRLAAPVAKRGLGGQAGAAVVQRHRP